jgi:NADH dehydrogenase
MIVVTGAAGFVGSHTVNRLAEMGTPVRALVHNRKRAEQRGRLQGLNVEIVAGDVTRPETLGPALQGATAVVHTVAIAVEKGGRDYETINTQGTINLVQAAQAAGVRRLINISQLGADAKLPYRFLASKGRAQEYVAASGLDWTALRPSAIWGPEDQFANSFARLVPLTPLIFPIVGGQNARFQLVWVEDVVSSIVKVLDDPTTIGHEYELGGPEVLTLEEIERRTLKALGARRLMIRFPMPLLRLVVTLMEKLLPAPPVTRSLLELLAVPNVTTHNAIYQFVPQPRPFSAENVAPYMRQFRMRDTLAQFLGK